MRLQKRQGEFINERIKIIDEELGTTERISWKLLK